MKNDARDAADLADLLRMGHLPEAWVAPPPVRELRELVRHRAKLVALRSGLKASVHAVLATQGVHIAVSDLFGIGGRQLLAGAPLDGAFRGRVDSLCASSTPSTSRATRWPGRSGPALRTHRGYTAIQTIPGIGPILAAVFVAEIGQVDRFTGPTQLASWAGLTPRHRESDPTVHRGRITKQGSTLVRWAAVEAAHSVPRSAAWLTATKARIGERRGRNIATVAVARKLLTLVFYGLRDGHIRALAPAITPAARTPAA